MAISTAIQVRMTESRTDGSDKLGKYSKLTQKAISPFQCLPSIPKERVEKRDATATSTHNYLLIQHLSKASSHSYGCFQYIVPYLYFMHAQSYIKASLTQQNKLTTAASIECEPETLITSLNTVQTSLKNTKGTYSCKLLD